MEQTARLFGMFANLIAFLALPKPEHDISFRHAAISKAPRRGEIKLPMTHTVFDFSHDNYPKRTVYCRDIETFVLPNFGDLSNHPMHLLPKRRAG